MGGIIWLASFPKSGNTWTRAFLHNLMINPDKPALPNRLGRFSLGDLQADHYTHVAGRPVSELTVEEIAPLRAKVNMMLTRASPDSVFVKTHNAMIESLGYPVISMDATAGAIYIVRNPLDVTISFADHFGIDIDEAIWRMADDNAITGMNDRQVPAVLTSWSKHVESWTASGAGPQLYIMRYEDMLTKPVKQFGGLCKFLGLDVPKPRLMKAIKFSNFRTMQVLESQGGFTERSEFSKKFFRKGTSGQWREILSPEQVTRICELHEEQMRRFDYLPKQYLDSGS